MTAQTDDGGRLARIHTRNELRMREFHEQHHADPTHSCNFKVKCRLCGTPDHPQNTTKGEHG